MITPPVGEYEAATEPVGGMIGRPFTVDGSVSFARRLMESFHADASYPAPASSHYLLLAVVYDCIRIVAVAGMSARDLAWFRDVAKALRTNADFRAAIEASDGGGAFGVPGVYMKIARVFVPPPTEANKTLSSAG